MDILGDDDDGMLDESFLLAIEQAEAEYRARVAGVPQHQTEGASNSRTAQPPLSGRDEPMASGSGIHTNRDSDRHYERSAVCQAPSLRQATLSWNAAQQDGGSKSNKIATSTSALAERQQQKEEAQPRDYLEGLDLSHANTLILPQNPTVRAYQREMIKACVMKNTLVSLPTGLGKTLIAAVVMYNFMRWFPKKKVVFMAPSRPLVRQQLEACLQTMGFPSNVTVEMTGGTNLAKRKELWENNRAFFLTPQVLANDLVNDVCNAPAIVCVIVDEAHRATGNHAYCKVVEELSHRSDGFRVVALSATPGSEMSRVQNVVSKLRISHMEVRNESDPDVQMYMHAKAREVVTIKQDERIARLCATLRELASPILQRLLRNRAILPHESGDAASPGSLIMAQKRFTATTNGKLAPADLKSTLADFSAAQVMLRTMFQLDTCGIEGPLESLETLKVNVGNSGFGPKAQIVRSREFTDAVSLLQQLQAQNVLHPKLDRLQQLVVKHFEDSHQIGEVGTRIMIFASSRESVAEICKLLRAHEPQVRPNIFLGQGAASNGAKGQTQNIQTEIVRAFHMGQYNTLICTCIGEEGLDVGEVDLIINYDIVTSPVRQVQRSGRTGRKREGTVMCLVMTGREEQDLIQAEAKCETLAKSLKAVEKGSKRLVLFDKARSLLPAEPTILEVDIQPCAPRTEAKKKPGKKKDRVLCTQGREWMERNDFQLGEEEGSEDAEDMDFDLNRWTDWNISPSPIYNVPHSRRCNLLIETMRSLAAAQYCSESEDDCPTHRPGLRGGCDKFLPKHLSGQGATRQCEKWLAECKESQIDIQVMLTSGAVQKKKRETIEKSVGVAEADKRPKKIGKTGEKRRGRKRKLPAWELEATTSPSESDGGDVQGDLREKHGTERAPGLDERANRLSKSSSDESCGDSRTMHTAQGVHSIFATVSKQVDVTSGCCDDNQAHARGKLGHGDVSGSHKTAPVKSKGLARASGIRQKSPAYGQRMHNEQAPAVHQLSDDVVVISSQDDAVANSNPELILQDDQEKKIMDNADNAEEMQQCNEQYEAMSVDSLPGDCYSPQNFEACITGQNNLAAHHNTLEANKHAHQNHSQEHVPDRQVFGSGVRVCPETSPHGIRQVPALESAESREANVLMDIVPSLSLGENDWRKTSDDDILLNLDLDALFPRPTPPHTPLCGKRKRMPRPQISNIFTPLPMRAARTPFEAASCVRGDLFPESSRPQDATVVENATVLEMDAELFDVYADDEADWIPIEEVRRSERVEKVLSTCDADAQAITDLQKTAGPQDSNALLEGNQSRRLMETTFGNECRQTPYMDIAGPAASAGSMQASVSDPRNFAYATNNKVSAESQQVSLATYPQNRGVHTGEQCVRTACHEGSMHNCEPGILQTSVTTHFNIDSNQVLQAPSSACHTDDCARISATVPPSDRTLAAHNAPMHNMTNNADVTPSLRNNLGVPRLHLFPLDVNAQRMGTLQQINKNFATMKSPKKPCVIRLEPSPQKSAHNSPLKPHHQSEQQANITSPHHSSGPTRMQSQRPQPAPVSTNHKNGVVACAGVNTGCMANSSQNSSQSGQSNSSQSDGRPRACTLLAGSLVAPSLRKVTIPNFDLGGSSSSSSDDDNDDKDGVPIQTAKVSDANSIGACQTSTTCASRTHHYAGTVSSNLIGVEKGTVMMRGSDAPHMHDNQRQMMSSTIGGSSHNVAVSVRNVHFDYDIHHEGQSARVNTDGYRYSHHDNSSNVRNMVSAKAQGGGFSKCAPQIGSCISNVRAQIEPRDGEMNHLHANNDSASDERYGNKGATSAVQQSQAYGQKCLQQDVMQSSLATGTRSAMNTEVRSDVRSMYVDGPEKGSHDASLGPDKGSHDASLGPDKGSHDASLGSDKGSHDASLGPDKGSHDASLGPEKGSHDASLGPEKGSHDASLGPEKGSHDASLGPDKGSHDASLGPDKGSHDASLLRRSGCYNDAILGVATCRQRDEHVPMGGQRDVNEGMGGRGKPGFQLEESDIADDTSICTSIVASVTDRIESESAKCAQKRTYQHGRHRRVQLSFTKMSEGMDDLTDDLASSSVHYVPQDSSRDRRGDASIYAHKPHTSDSKTSQQGMHAHNAPFDDQYGRITRHVKESGLPANQQKGTDNMVWCNDEKHMGASISRQTFAKLQVDMVNQKPTICTGKADNHYLTSRSIDHSTSNAQERGAQHEASSVTCKDKAHPEFRRESEQEKQPSVYNKPGPKLERRTTHVSDSDGDDGSIERARQSTCEAQASSHQKTKKDLRRQCSGSGDEGSSDEFEESHTAGRDSRDAGQRDGKGSAGRGVKKSTGRDSHRRKHAATCERTKRRKVRSESEDERCSKSAENSTSVSDSEEDGDSDQMPRRRPDRREVYKKYLSDEAELSGSASDDEEEETDKELEGLIDDETQKTNDDAVTPGAMRSIYARSLMSSQSAGCRFGGGMFKMTHMVDASARDFKSCSSDSQGESEYESDGFIAYTDSDDLTVGESGDSDGDDQEEHAGKQRVNPLFGDDDEEKDARRTKNRHGKDTENRDSSKKDRKMRDKHSMETQDDGKRDHDCHMSSREYSAHRDDEEDDEDTGEDNNRRTHREQRRHARNFKKEVCNSKKHRRQRDRGHKELGKNSADGEDMEDSCKKPKKRRRIVPVQATQEDGSASNTQTPCLHNSITVQSSVEKSSEKIRRRSMSRWRKQRRTRLLLDEEEGDQDIKMSASMDDKLQNSSCIQNEHANDEIRKAPTLHMHQGVEADRLQERRGTHMKREEVHDIVVIDDSMDVQSATKGRSGDRRHTNAQFAGNSAMDVQSATKGRSGDRRHTSAQFAENSANLAGKAQQEPFGCARLDDDAYQRQALLSRDDQGLVRKSMTEGHTNEIPRGLQDGKRIGGACDATSLQAAQCVSATISSTRVSAQLTGSTSNHQARSNVALTACDVSGPVPQTRYDEERHSSTLVTHSVSGVSVGAASRLGASGNGSRRKALSLGGKKAQPSVMKQLQKEQCQEQECQDVQEGQQLIEECEHQQHQQREVHHQHHQPLNEYQPLYQHRQQEHQDKQRQPEGFRQYEGAVNGKHGHTQADIHMHEGRNCQVEDYAQSGVGARHIKFGEKHEADTRHTTNSSGVCHDRKCIGFESESKDQKRKNPPVAISTHQNPQPIVRNIVRDSARDKSRDSTHESPRDSTHESPRDSTHESPRDSTRDNVRHQEKSEVRLLERSKDCRTAVATAEGNSSKQHGSVKCVSRFFQDQQDGIGAAQPRTLPHLHTKHNREENNKHLVGERPNKENHEDDLRGKTNNTVDAKCDAGDGLMACGGSEAIRAENSVNACVIAVSREESNGQVCGELRRLQAGSTLRVVQCGRLKDTSYVLGKECAVLRKTSSQLVTEAARADISESLASCRSMYGTVYLMIDVSQASMKTGYDPMYGDPKKYVEALCGSAMVKGVSVLTITSPECGARLLHSIAERQNRAGVGLDWPEDEDLRNYLSGVQENPALQMILSIPNVSLTSALAAFCAVPCLADLAQIAQNGTSGQVGLQQAFKGFQAQRLMYLLEGLSKRYAA